MHDFSTQFTKYHGLLAVSRRSIIGGGNLQDTANHDILRALILPGYPTSMYHSQTPVNTETGGLSVRIQSGLNSGKM